jgi:hypothetical protein
LDGHRPARFPKIRGRPAAWGVKEFGGPAARVRCSDPRLNTTARPTVGSTNTYHAFIGGRFIPAWRRIRLRRGENEREVYSSRRERVGD